MEHTQSQRTEVTVIACCDAESIAACYDVMHELRDGLDRAGYDERVVAARTQGYRLARAEERSQVVGVIGYRLWNDLVFGRSLFVDDLVVAAARRGGGIGQALLAHAEAEARREDCAALRLNSGLWREDAHRFYEAFGLHKRGFAFVKALEV
ncbi:GNAT family N-acetyltransferase [Pelagibius sp.]|uniref:GNAT family N-acetyltransferase n=1 Tax=Pelagibius sp. TaxID=1931238 RepID=UPI00261905FB|nr:GNAT family N-acetyltransferase [Pelagibius sp.]